jgi:hypothetical protein
MMQMQAEKILADVLVETPVQETHPALAERIAAFLRGCEREQAEMDAHMDATEPVAIPVVRGIRLTDCCDDMSSYMDDGKGNEALCCRTCYREVPVGQGDGAEVAR